MFCRKCTTKVRTVGGTLQLRRCLVKTGLKHAKCCKSMRSLSMNIVRNTESLDSWWLVVHRVRNCSCCFFSPVVLFKLLHSSVSVSVYALSCGKIIKVLASHQFEEQTQFRPFPKSWRTVPFEKQQTALDSVCIICRPHMRYVCDEWSRGKGEILECRVRQRICMFMMLSCDFCQSYLYWRDRSFSCHPTVWMQMLHDVLQK